MMAKTIFLVWMGAAPLVAAMQDPPQALLHNLERALQDGRVDDALKTLDLLLRAHPTSTEAEFGLSAVGRHWIEQGEFQRGLSYFRQIRERFGHAEDVRERLRDMLEGFKHTKRKGVAIQPGEAGVTVHVPTRGFESFVGVLLQADPETAIRLIREGRDCAPSREELKVLGKWIFNAHHGTATQFAASDVRGLIYFEERCEGLSWLHGPIQTLHATVLAWTDLETTTIFAADMEGNPLGGASLVSADGTEVRFDRGGFARVPAPAGEQGGWVAVAREGRVQASHVPARPFARYPIPRHYGYADRHLYSPGQTVHYKVVLREWDGRSLRIPDPRPCVVRVVAGHAERVVQEVTLQPGEFGTIAGSFALAAECVLGEYQVRVDGVLCATFRVETFRKPEFKVDIWLEEGVAGNVEAVIRATYFFGQPVAGASVECKVGGAGSWRRGPAGAIDPMPFPDDIRTPVFFRPVSRGGSQFTLDEPRRIGEALRTDANGQVRVRVPAEIFETWSAARVTATVYENQAVASQGEGVFERDGGGELAVGLDRLFAGMGEPVTARVAGAKENERLRFTLFRAIVLERGQTEFEEVASHTQDGPAAEWTFTPETAGLLRLRVRSMSGAERRMDFWCHGPGFQPDEIGVMVERFCYRPGDTARVLLTCDEQDAVFLLALERETLVETRRVTVRGGWTVLEIPVRESFANGVRVTAHRLDGPSPKFPVSTWIRIIPLESMLAIRIEPERDEFRPGTEARIAFRVTDGNGRPVRAELSAALVDPGLFEVRKDKTPDIRRFYLCAKDFGSAFGSGDDGVTFVDSFDGPDVSFALKEGASPRPRTRFEDTGYWNARIVTDDAGRAEVRVALPDNITRWKLIARAVSASTQVGQQEGALLVKKPVFARLLGPKSLTARDRAEFVLGLHNDTAEPRRMRVRAAVEGGRLESPSEREATVRPGGSERVPLALAAGESGPIRVSVEIDAGDGIDMQDALRVEIPVRPRGFDAWILRSGTAAPSSAAKFEIPRGIDRSRAEVTVSLSPSLLHVVQEALPYLQEYPYGCVEQTMSRFLPAVSAWRAGSNAGTAAISARLGRMVNAGLQRLYRFQHGDGGWGWWREDATNPRMTAYVVYGLDAARRAGVFVDPGTLEGGVQAVLSLAGDVRVSEIDRCFLRYVAALCAPERKIEGEGAAIELGGDAPLLARAYLALEAAHRGRRDVARALADRVYAAEWKDTATAAFGLRAMAAADPADPRLPEALSRLMRLRAGPIWGNTLDTAQAVFALLDYIAARGWQEASAGTTVRATLNGREILKREIDPRSGREFPAIASVPADRIEGDAVDVRVEVAGGGVEVAYAVSLRYLETADPMRPVRAPIAVARQYMRVMEDPENNEWAEPLEAWSRLKVGDQIAVRLTVWSEGGEIPTVMLEDAVPAGFEVVRDNDGDAGSWLWGGWSDMEIRDDRVGLALSSVGAAPMEVAYRLRAAFPGEYRVLPARAFNMYQEAEAGRSGEFALEVAGK